MPSVQMSDKVTILTQWEEDQPRSGIPRDLWYQKMADQLGLTSPQVARVVGDAAARHYREIEGRVQTDAQNVADYMGLTLGKILQVINEGLEAEEITILRDGSGNIVYGKDKKPLELRRPIWPVRLKSAEQGLMVMNGYAPRESKVEVSGEVQHVLIDAKALTEEELEKHALHLQRAIEGAAEVRRQKRLASPPSDEGGGAGGDGADDPPRHEGHLVLGNGMHGNEG
jgi:hypothetical protein